MRWVNGTERRRGYGRLRCWLIGVAWLAVSQVPARGFELLRLPDGTPSLISPTLTAAPIEVLLWVRNNVTLDDQAWITGVIRAALDRWQGIPTARIRFVITTVRSPTQPPRAREQLLVVVANLAQLTSSGGIPPLGGFPGTWLWAAADWRNCGPGCSSMDVIATHELGHTLGLMHSSIDDLLFPAAPLPIMYFAARSTGLTQDDVAALSLAYPNPALPLGQVTGTLEGTCVTPTPLRTTPTTPAERSCQQAVASASSHLGRAEIGCLLACDAARRAGARRRCAASDDDPKTQRCLVRHEKATMRRVARSCGGTSNGAPRCPACLDADRDCDPDHGFGAWLSAGFDRPALMERRRAESLFAALTCNSPGASPAERRCRRTVLIASVAASRAIRSCFQTCNERRQDGTLPTGANCVPGDEHLDGATGACMTARLDAFASALSCPLPACAAKVAARLPSLITEPAARDQRLLYCDAVLRTPLAGVNVVAVDHGTGMPVVARLSGAAGAPGGFRIIGLPTGSYDLHLLGGTSFRGSYPMAQPERIQSDNFPPTVLGPYSVAAGDVLDLGDVTVPIEPLSADRVSIGNRYNYQPFDLGSGVLPQATRGVTYARWIHLRGGVRPLSLVGVTGLPSGLSATLEAPSGYSNDPYGQAWIRIVGAPEDEGTHSMRFDLRDMSGALASLPLALSVLP